MTRIIQFICIIAITLSIVACSALGGRTELNSTESLKTYGGGLQPVLGIAQCKAVLSWSEPDLANELSSEKIQILNWNIKKGKKRNWSDDLSSYSTDKHLVLIQEATVSMGLLDILSGTQFSSFSPGFISGGEISGVATFSQVEPIGRCRLESMEPWLGTPKLTNITRYALSDSDETLVVVNIHAVNFSFGLDDYRQQIQQVTEVLSVHTGPVVFSGDFNTWREGRLQTLLETVSTMNVQHVSFDEDHRVKFLGSVLDHVFIRGLEVLAANTHQVNSSDHNPLSLSLRLY